MDIVMPSLGADMEEGTLVEWKVAVGDIVQKGDIIAVIETQKGAIDMEVYNDGVISALLLQPVITVPVGTVMATMTVASEKLTTPPPVVSTAPVVRHRVSPAARKAAEASRIDLSLLEGSGADGAVLLSDLPGNPESKVTGNVPDKASAVNLDGMRKSIAAAMEKSKREIPHYYLSLDIDITEAKQYLEAINARREPEERLLLLALLLRACARALVDYPELNGFYREGKFIAAQQVHIGNAISLRGNGLVVPAIHAVETLSPDKIMMALRDLTVRSRSGHLRSSELTDATVTVTSIGERGADVVFGIIYPPQVSIVGFGRPRQMPVVINNNIIVRQMITVTLSADHRVSDGTLGAKFLSAMASLLQQPASL